MNKYRTVLLFLFDYKNFSCSDKNRTVFLYRTVIYNMTNNIFLCDTMSKLYKMYRK